MSLLAGPDRWHALTGLASSQASSATLGSLLHLGVGPIGATPLAWGFALAAVLPLVIGTGPRLGWAGRSWVLAVWSLALAWAGGRGWLGAFGPPTQVLLAPAAVGISLAIGLGVAAFEEDLTRHRFGWRHAAGGIAALCTVAAAVPVLAATASGRWDMPVAGYGQATSWMAHEAPGDFRVLWVGDPQVLPGGGWQVAPGLAYALSENGVPDATSMWPGSSPGPAATVGQAVRKVASGETVHAGRLLAPYAIRYVVVVHTLGPTSPGTSMPLGRDPPPGLVPGLSTQVDLRQVISQGGFEVFVDDTALPLRAVHRAPLSAASPLAGWRPVLPGSPGATEVRGRVGTGTVYDATSPTGAWQLVGPGGQVQSAQPAFDDASRFSLSRPGTVAVRYVGSWRHDVAIGVQLALWLVVLGAFALRWRGPARSQGSSRRNRPRHRQQRTRATSGARSESPRLGEPAR